MDDAREKADKELEKLEKKIKKEYTTAKKEITKEWREYMKTAGKRVDEMAARADVWWTDSEHTLEEVQALEKRLERLKTSVTLRDERYRAVVDGFTDRLAHTNEIALAYANDTIPALYAIGYNQAGADMTAIGLDFTLYNEHTVKNLFRQDKAIFPKKKLKIEKDKRWNTKKINSAVLQGILQGESMDKIASRIYPIVDSNASAAIRSARTLVTGAENKGRLDSYKEMQNNGVVLNKVWLATPDGRTRDWHIEMDGQSVGVNEMFVDGLGNELEYPADPMGAPESVYNCRCTMYTDIVGFISPTTGELIEVDYTGIDKEDEQHREQMQDEKARRADVQRRREEARQKMQTKKPETSSPRGEPEKKDKSKRLEGYKRWTEEEQRAENARMGITAEEERIIYAHRDKYGYVGTSNSFAINKAHRLGRFDELEPNQKETSRTLERVIARNTISEDARFTRMIGYKYMNKNFGIDDMMLDDILANFGAYSETLNEFVGKKITEDGFMSVSSRFDKNVFRDRPCVIELFADEGTHAYVTHNYWESETIFPLKTDYIVRGFSVREVDVGWGEKENRLFISATVKKK